MVLADLLIGERFMELWVGCHRCRGEDRRENQALYVKLKEELKNCVSRVSKHKFYLGRGLA